MFRWLVLLLLCLAGTFNQLPAQSYTPGQSYFGSGNYIEYLAGDFPLILSAPHGGLLSPASIPDRSCSGCSTVNDFNTQELARALYEAVHARTGCYPHLIVNRLHRRKLDANRDLAEAADGNPTAEKAWADFHSFLESAHAAVERDFGKGFYLDLHGHAHSVQRLELGYLLSKNELQHADSVLNTFAYVQESSIQNLVNQNDDGLSHADLLRGPEALGTLLAAHGYPAVPAAADPYPDGAEDYFNGGYNTARYSSYNGGFIDGVQIECNRTGVRDSIQQVKRFADTLAVVLLDYLQRRYFGQLSDGLCAQVPQSTLDSIRVDIYPNPYCRNFYVEQTGQNQELELGIYDFYGNFLRNSHLPPGIPLEFAFSTPKNVYLVLRKNGAVIWSRAVLYYCK